MDLDGVVSEFAQPDGQVPKSILEDSENDQMLPTFRLHGIDDPDELIHLGVGLVRIVVVSVNQGLRIVEIAIDAAGNLTFSLNQAQGVSTGGKLLFSIDVILNNGSILIQFLRIEMDDARVGVPFCLGPVGCDLPLACPGEDIVHRTHGRQVELDVDLGLIIVLAAAQLPDDALVEGRLIEALIDGRILIVAMLVLILTDGIVGSDLGTGKILPDVIKRLICIQRGDGLDKGLVDGQGIQEHRVVTVLLGIEERQQVEEVLLLGHHRGRSQEDRGGRRFEQSRHSPMSQRLAVTQPVCLVAKDEIELLVGILQSLENLVVVRQPDLLIVDDTPDISFLVTDVVDKAVLGVNLEIEPELLLQLHLPLLHQGLRTDDQRVVQLPPGR